MEKDTIVISRKIQLFIDCEDREKRLEYYGKLFEWGDLTYRAANLVVSHQFMLDHLPDITYLMDGVKAKLANFRNNPEGVLTTSKMNASYQILSRYFKGKLPSDVMASINMMLNKNFKMEQPDYWKGEKSLRNYKKGMPIPFSGSSLRLSDDGDGFKFVLFKVPFRTYLGKDKSDKLERFKEKEKRYVDDRLHLYSRRLIDICIKAGAGTLLLVNQTAKVEVAKEDEFLLRNWSYYGLVEKIKYKAEMNGINVIVE